MSTYDAYNLSLRDSTEFTVPTGGGFQGGDFSVVPVTVINSTDMRVTVFCPITDETTYQVPGSLSAAFAPANGEVTLNCILYKGVSSLLVLEGNVIDITISGSASKISIIPNTLTAMITGEATITLIGDENNGGTYL